MGKFLNEFQRVTREQEKEDLVEKGKERYANAELNEKLEILEKSGKLDTTLSDWKLLHEQIKDKLPVMIYHCNTTGLRPDDEITNFSMVVAEYNSKTGKYEITDGFDSVVEANPEIVKRAVAEYENAVKQHEEYEKQYNALKENDVKENLIKAELRKRGVKDAKPYDVFVNSGFAKDDLNFVGITKEDYVNHNYSNDLVLTQEELKNKIEEFNKKYELLTLHITFNDFTDKQLKNIDMNNSLKVNLMDVCTQFDYLQIKETTEENILNNNGQNYTLDNLALNLNINDLSSSKSKVEAMYSILNEIGDRAKLLNFKEILEKKACEYQSKLLDTLINEYEGIGNIPAPKIMGLGYSIDYKDGAMSVSSNLSEETILEFAKRYDEIVLEKTEEKNDKEHGNIYSSKRNDTLDVVVGDVKKIGEVEIPYVSEALRNEPVTNEMMQSVLATLTAIQRNVEILTASIQRLESKEIKSKENKVATSTKVKTRTIDKTEKERGEKPLKNLPLKVIADDLKGHEYENQDELEEEQERNTR